MVLVLEKKVWDGIWSLFTSSSQNYHSNIPGPWFFVLFSLVEAQDI